MDYFGIEDANFDARSSPTSQLGTQWKPEKVDRVPKPQEKQVAILELPDDNGGVKRIELPILQGTCGPPAIDIRKLFPLHNYITYDPGFGSTGSCHSDITFIDGPRGVLMYRGYLIESLAEHSDFLDCSYLLLYGELPSANQKTVHKQQIASHMMVHEKLLEFYKGFKSDAHPMAIMVGVVGALSAFYHDSLNISNSHERMLSAYRLIAKMPTIAAIAYRTHQGYPIVYPREDLSYAENFLFMMFASPTRDYVVPKAFVRALDVFLILHMDHEQNASTSTVRIAGSSHANPYACVGSGITALWGPAHGGANEAVLRMLAEIGTVDRIPMFLEKAKDKSDPFRLMGFGHRVYKNFDPRAKIMRQMCYDVMKELGIKKPPLLELALKLEEAALKDSYFIQRKLYPNVDFYSGIALKAMGIPVSMFTVLFAVARTVGWIAQWKEMIEDPLQRIGRPRQVYQGKEERAYVPVEKRAEVVDLDADTTHSLVRRMSIHYIRPNQ